MLTLKSLDITSFDIDKLTLTWDFDDTSEAISGYSIGIYRSENPGVSGLLGFDLVEAGIPATAYVYQDYTVSGIFDPLRVWYYKLKFTETATLTESVVPNIPAFRKSTTTDLAALEIVRRKGVVLAQYSGRDFFIIKKRTYGTHCTVCWDTILQRITDDSCDVCNGTGWVDGYFKAIYLKGMLNPAPKYNQITMFGEWMPHDALFTMLNFPPIRTRDIIVDDRNQRWIVKQIRKTEKLGYVIEYNAQCSLISFNDQIYELEKNTLEIVNAVLATDVAQVSDQTTVYAVVKQLLDSYWYESSQGEESVAIQWVNNLIKAPGVYTSISTATVVDYNMHELFHTDGSALDISMWSVVVNSLVVHRTEITSIVNSGSNIIITFNLPYDLEPGYEIELWGPLIAT